MVDSVPWQILLIALAGWVNRHQLEAFNSRGRSSGRKCPILPRVPER